MIVYNVLVRLIRGLPRGRKGDTKMTRTERMKMESLNFSAQGVAIATTASGKKIWIRRNDRNINNTFFTVDLEDRHLFSRGGINKVFEAIKNN